MKARRPLCGTGIAFARLAGNMSSARVVAHLVATAACAGIATSGCGHGALTPAPSATLVPNAPTAAYSVAEGVRCSANVGAWSGRKGDLPPFVVPVKVRIKNASGKPIQVLYEDFVLVGKKGRSYRPIPVLPIDTEAGESALKVDLLYASSKFYVAPRFRDVYASLDPWSAPLQRDATLHAKLFRRWGDKRPRPDVLRTALPEGVLDDGGIVTGFLFFESPLGKETRVTLEAEFDADDGQGPVASIEIPFRIE